jgi:hypothetical protein
MADCGWGKDKKRFSIRSRGIGNKNAAFVRVKPKILYGIAGNSFINAVGKMLCLR